ncbi:YqjD family protein [Pseudooceanicola sp. LIPI14-2-Ac024]|uniref:DUF883 family protein n=1 Tax=Pseudooceanicola sp. LIPI14-2-Ac024 TaxID=3344875 RepID=UPI0035D062FE
MKSTDTDDIQKQLSALQADMSELTKLVGDYGKSQGSRFQAAAKDTVDKLRHDAEAQYHKAEAQMHDSYAKAEQAVRENPGMALGIAAGVGFVVGLLASRR